MGISNVFITFSNFHAYVKTQFKHDIQLFQCDNGREFNNQLLLNFILSNCIKVRFSCPYTSQQNGKVELAIRLINNILRTFLFQGFSQQPNIYFDDTLTSVVKVNTIRTVLSIDTSKNWPVN